MRDGEGTVRHGEDARNGASLAPMGAAPPPPEVGELGPSGATLEPAVQALVDREVRLLDRHGQGLVVHDRNGRLVQANDHVVDRGGLRWDGSQLIPADGWEVVGRDGRVIPDEQLPRAIAQRMGGAVSRVDLGLRDPSGLVSWCAVTASPVKARDGDTVAVVTTMSALDLSDPGEDGPTGSTQLAILACDAHGLVTYVSPEAEVLYGCRAAEARGRRAADVVTWDLPPARIAQMLVVDGRSRPWAGEVWIRGRDGRCAPAPLTITPVTTAGDETLVITVAVERADGNRRGLDQPVPGRDELTGLLARRNFIDALGRRCESRRVDDAPIVLVILHLEDLRIINDTADSCTGDHVIRSAAQALGQAMHVGDTAGRLSGTSFAVCFQASPSTDVEEYVTRLRRAIALPISVAAADHVRLRCSAGFAMSSAGVQTAEDLLQAADLALARARADTRDESLVYREGLRDRIHRDLRIEVAVREALATGTVNLGYQPIVGLSDCRVVEVEALLRLEDGDGPLPALDVIEVAEGRGLIGELGLLILETACREAATWRATAGDRPIGVCVNVSAHQLDDPHLDAKVRRILVETGLDPAELNLEMTETALMSDSTWTAGQLSRLKRLGIRLSVDDFGTGYSSLAYLKRFPLDVIKADLSFVAGLPSSVEDGAVVQAIIGLAEVLGLSVVAEGVSREDQLEALRSMGCGFGQGYLWSRAVAATEVPRVAAAVRAAVGTSAPTADPLTEASVAPKASPLVPAADALRRFAAELVQAADRSVTLDPAMRPVLDGSRRLVADLDVLAAIDADSLDLAAEAVDVLAVVRSVTRAEERDGTTVRVEPLLVGAALAWCDAGLVGRAVRALIENAIVHAGSAGARSGPLVLVGRRGRWVDVSVHDRGPGIQRSWLPLAFSRYGRVPEGEGGPGLGIGLALAREVARLHGGDLVHRTPSDGIGSVFTLRLPAVAGPSAVRSVLVGAATGGST